MMMTQEASEKDLTKLRTDIETRINEFRLESEKLQSQFEKTILGLESKGYHIDKTQVKEFMAHFWHVYPTKDPYRYEVAIPVYIPFNIGHYDRTDGGYNIFSIDKFTKWLGEEIPAFIAKEINIPQGLKITVSNSVASFPAEIKEKVEAKFGNHLSLVEDGKATVRQGHEYQLVSEIIDSGSLPFIPHPVEEIDLRPSAFTQIWNEKKDKYEPLELYKGKYSYQGRAWLTFKEYGCAGFFWPPGFGKTVIGTVIHSSIKGEKVEVIPTKTLDEQWKQFWEKNCPTLIDEVQLLTYQGMTRLGPKELREFHLNVLGFDECQFLPAPSFSRLGTIPTKYRFGGTATPYREDGCTNYIMALTGIPVGLDWKSVMAVLGKKYHTVNVHIVKNLQSKYDLVKQLYNPERKTIIFVFLLDEGRKLSEIFDIPFISGETKDRMKIAKESTSFIASRVMELGISLKDLEQVIEFGFFKGSRSGEVQVTGRLMHSEIVEGKVHDILFTQEELEKFGKRLSGLYEKGFRYKLISHVAEKFSSGISTEEHTKKTTRGSREIVDELFNEGYFVKERVFADITSEISKRGGKISPGNIASKLNSLVLQKKLFKIKTEKGYQFKQR
jgi:hypothetical protein